MNSKQQEIVENLHERGYPVIRTAGSTARQAMKMLEEVIELNNCGTANPIPRDVEKIVKYLFVHNACGEIEYSEAVKNELADVLVTFCSTCASLGLDIDAVLDLAVEKSKGDIARGVRKI